jgi:hypothetical protein
MVELVDSEDWMTNVANRLPGTKYEDINEAIDQLQVAPVGTRLKIPLWPSGAKMKKEFSRKASRAGLKTHTYAIQESGWLYIRLTAKLAVKSTKGETTQHSGELNNQRGPLTSRGRSLNSGVSA